MFSCCFCPSEIPFAQVSMLCLTCPVYGWNYSSGLCDVDDMEYPGDVQCCSLHSVVSVNVYLNILLDAI